MKNLLFAIPLLSAALLTGTEAAKTPAGPARGECTAEENLPAEATRPAELPADVRTAVGNALAEAAHAVAVGAEMTATPAPGTAPAFRPAKKQNAPAKAAPKAVSATAKPPAAKTSPSAKQPTATPAKPSAPKALPVPAAEKKPAPAVKPLPVAEKKPAPAVKPLPATEKKPAPAVKPLPVAEKKPAPAVKPLPVAEKKPAPAVKPLPVAEKKPAPAVKPLPATEKKPAPAVKPLPATEKKPAPAVKPLPATEKNLIPATELQSAAAQKPAPVAEPLSKKNSIGWKVPTFSLIARNMPLHEAFESFGSAQGMSVLMTDAVAGLLSGEFRSMPADEFLDRITALHNLLWYYDGAALYICGSGEVQTMLLSLRYMKVDEVRATLRELGVEDSRFPIRTASNGEMILVSGPPRYVSIVAETIAKADALREQRTFNEVETRIFPLKHTWADDVTLRVNGPESSGTIRGVAGMLREIMEESAGNKVRERPAETAADGRDKTAASNAQQDDDALNAAMKDVFRPIIKADNRLNTVIVRDVATRMPMYERLIQQLDKPQKLVEIGVTVVELSREDALDWQLSLKVEGAHEEFEGAAGQNAGNLLKDVGGRGLAGTASYLGEDVTVSGSLTALKDKGKTRSISRTSLLTLNNFAAELSDMQSYHARVVGTEVASLEEVSAGTHLQIKPRIIRSDVPDKPDRVWMTMQLQDGGFESVAVDSMPVTRTSTLETQASVQVGHSLLLAGYLRDIKESAGWGIPYLRDIPWIGWLFGGATYKTETVQRLFILTPYIVDADAPDVTRAQATRQRDITHEMTLESDSDADHLDRREREAQIEEQQKIREEREEERHLRNNEERDFRREQRQDLRWEDRERWEADFDRRRQDYAAERDVRHEAVKAEVEQVRREAAEREKARQLKKNN